MHVLPNIKAVLAAHLTVCWDFGQKLLLETLFHELQACGRSQSSK